MVVVAVICWELNVSVFLEVLIAAPGPFGFHCMRRWLSAAAMAVRGLCGSWCE